MKVTRITLDNFKNFIAHRVEVEISSYDGGLTYPDDNVLVGMNEDHYYFLSDSGTDDEHYWHWTSTEDAKNSIMVWPKEEYDEFYHRSKKLKLSKLIEETEIDGQTFVPILELMDVAMESAFTTINWSDCRSMVEVLDSDEFFVAGCIYKDAHLRFKFEKKFKKFSLTTDGRELMFDRLDLMRLMEKWNFYLS